MATIEAVQVETQIAKYVRHYVALLLKRPITEEIAMKIGTLDAFKQLEIINGEWVGLEEERDEFMTGEYHGWLETKLIVLLGTWVIANKTGRIYPGDTDFVLDGSKDDIRERRQPDVAFVSKARLQKTSGYFYGAPDLAIEIISPSQDRDELAEKAEIFLQYGTQQVWLIDPIEETLEVLTSDDAPVIYTKTDTVSGGDLLPDFELAIVTLFEE